MRMASSNPIGCDSRLSSVTRFFPFTGAKPMPEGHTVHRIAQDHAKEFSGQKLIVTSPQGRFEKEAGELSGRYLLGTEAIGKHLIYLWGGKRKTNSRGATANKPARIMHVHLGLYGKFRLHSNPAPEPRGAVRVRMIGQQKAFDLNGPNCCELLDADAFSALRMRLGQDPLRDDADASLAWAKISKSRRAIGALLLDQSVIAGLGNIYRAEILWLVGIHPERRGVDVTPEEFDHVWQLSVDLLAIGLKYNRIITVDRKDVDKPLSRLSRDQRLNIYKKRRCRECGGKTRWWEVAARKMYACENCQA